MVSASDLATWLAALSSLAVIVGVSFVVIQLRQNARLLEATLRQQRSDVAASVLERVTDESFPRRRHEMHAIVRKFAETGWKDAYESPEDFEVRNFAFIYELFGVMGKHGLIDLDLLTEVMQGLIVRDWQAFAPHAAWMRERFKDRYSGHLRPYSHFEWLAQQTENRMRALAAEPAS